MMHANDVIKDLNNRATDAIVDFKDSYEFGNWSNHFKDIKTLEHIQQEISTLMHFIYSMLADYPALKTYYADVVRIYNKVRKVLSKYDD